MNETVWRGAIDGQVIALKKPHDLSWLAEYGRVFAVFDQQDSGNLCFGIENERGKLFLKYAGAETVRAHELGTPPQAIARLRRALPLYRHLRHPLLTELLAERELPQGYLAVFDWREGCLLRGSAPAGERSALQCFAEQPLAEQLDVMEGIILFHGHVERLGYLAVDFYDGSLLYDFDDKRLTLIDIDEYQPGPFVNEMGRMFGSSRFMSPEEKTLGATIDSRTNVFLMGATAFVLLGGGLDRSRSKWRAGQALYRVALRAVAEAKEERYASLAEFAAAWQAALPSPGDGVHDPVV